METEPELARLRKRVERERRARQEAEALAEQGTRQLYERGQELQLLYTIADACGRAATVEEALKVALDELCTFTGWPVGHAYLVEREPTLSLASTDLWYLEDEKQFEAFHRASVNPTFRPGEGLPGRVFEKAATMWLADVTSDENFPRAKAAAAAGIRSAIGVPVLIGDQVVAVLEFFSRESANPKERWLDVMAQIGLQVGRTFERAAHDKAEAANRAKSEFLSRMSHELRTPLNAIIGFSQLLEMSDLPANQRERVGYIQRAGRHLLTLINEVLDISRIEAGHFELALEAVAVGPALREVVALVQPLAAERAIDIKFAENEDPTVCVLADRQRLKQVLLNLVANAVKYNRERGSVVLSYAEPVNDRVRIAIADTGIGIADEKRDRLFLPFDRLGAEQTAVQGTGLGLTLSQRFAEAMSGSLGFTSEIDVGSTFWLELPHAQNAPTPVASAQSVSRPAAFCANENTKVLYIEDNVSNLALVEHLVRSHSNLRLLSAGQGQLGLELASKHRPDLILLDVHLPDMDGAEILRRLRTDAVTREIPVVILSADATTRQIARFRDAGANDYMTKPLDVPRFFEVIHEQTHAGAKTVLA